MALYQANQIVAGQTVPSSSDGVAVCHAFGDIVVPAAGFALNDVIEMAPLPPGHVPVNATVVCEDLDSGTALTLDAGVLSGDFAVKDNARTCGSEFFAASTVGQAGGLADMNKAAGALLAPADNTRGVGLKVAANATGWVAGAKIRFTLLFRPHTNGV